MLGPHKPRLDLYELGIVGEGLEALRVPGRRVDDRDAVPWLDQELAREGAHVRMVAGAGTGVPLECGSQVVRGLAQSGSAHGSGP